jgi:two-component system sensor histidine kinase/response regulator
MPAAPIPPNESERLAALKRYEILDTTSEAEFDNFTKLASQICETPIALISLVDAGRQWFKSKKGLEVSETPRELSFCAHAILGQGLYEVPNALNNPQFRDNAHVTGPPDIRFYAGMPLTTFDGLNLGTLCVIDRVPRKLTQPQREALAILGSQVVAQMELKLAKRELQEKIALHERMEARLAVVSKGFEDVLDAATHVSIIATDPEGIITIFNSGAERMLGYRADEIVGKHTPAILHLESEVNARGLELTKELGRPVSGFDVFIEKTRGGHHEVREWTYVRKYGRTLTVNLIATGCYDISGDVIGYLGVAVDVTARKKAEKTLRDQALILDLANDTIFIRDIKNHITYWNQGAERLYGWKREEVLGQVTHELFKTQFPQPIDEIEKQLFATGHWQGDLVHTCRDGSQVIVTSSWTLQRDDSNFPASVIEMNHDITARKRAEQELGKSQARLNTILNSSLDGVIVYEAVRDKAGALKDLRFTMVNPTAEKLVRRDAASLIGRSLLETFPNVVSDGLYEKFTSIVEKGQNMDFEYRSTRDTTTRWYRVAGVKLGDGLVISYAEITARKEHEKQLREAKEKAELADTAKSEFLANMSHEIRTPMNGVIGMTGLLLDTWLNPDQRILADTIRTSAESLLTLINGVLDFSKIEAGKLSFEENDFDLRKIVESTLDLLAGQAQAKGIELVGGFELEMPTKLRGDSGRVQQVLTNLIGNAIKFTKTGEVSIHVSSDMTTDADVLVRFEIKDTGEGIPPETQSRLFQPFVQADSSTSRKFGGTGLGLAICKSLAESMNGQIGVKSNPGDGATFWVTMKFLRQPEVPSLSQITSDFGETRVLVVDDNQTTRDVLKEQISRWKMQCEVASSAEEALEKLNQAAINKTSFQLAIVDLQMPTKNGFMLSQDIKEDPQLGETRIILLMPFGKSIPSDDMEAVKIAACCGKPVRQSALFDCIVQVLTRPETMVEATQTATFLRSGSLTLIRKERILLAEDNDVNQQVALGNLRKLGYKADLATNGLEVLDALQKKQYDIILMDCQMPELDGYAATREIRKREKFGHRTWIIAMTANVMVGDREKCIEAGMDDYISKPIRRNELRVALENCVPEPASSVDESALHSLQEESEDDLSELVEIFTSSAPTTMAQIRDALQRSNASDLYMAAHTLKGSCSNLGKSPLRDLGAQIELIARDGTIEGTADLVASAEKELRSFIEALKPYRKTPPDE